MGLEEFLDFDSSAYATELGGLSNSQLKARKQKESREFTSSSVSLGVGLGTLVPTAGLSAIWMSIAARKLDIADKKTDLLDDELRRRGLDAKFELSGADIGVVAAGGTSSLVMGNAYGNEVNESGLGGVDVRDSGATIAGNIYGDVVGKNQTNLAERLMTKEWTESSRSALRCQRLAGIWPAVSRVTCNACHESIEKGLFAREFFCARMSG